MTATSVGITWKAPTANTKGASISHFVIQIAGAGISFEDKVQKVVSWPNSRDAFVQFKEDVKAIKAQGADLSEFGESLFGDGDPVRIAKVNRYTAITLSYSLTLTLSYSVMHSFFAYLFIS